MTSLTTSTKASDQTVSLKPYQSIHAITVMDAPTRSRLYLYFLTQ